MNKKFTSVVLVIIVILVLGTNMLFAKKGAGINRNPTDCNYSYLLQNVCQSAGESEAYQGNAEHYTLDSINHEWAPSLQPGTTTVIGTIDKATCNGEELSNVTMEITMAKVNYIQSETLRDNLRKIGLTDEQMDKYLNFDILHPGAYETVDKNDTITLTVRFIKNADGTYTKVIDTPQNIDIVNYSYKAVDAKINGEEMQVNTFYTFYVDNGGNTPTPPTPEKGPSSGVSISISTIPFKDMDANVRGSISSNQYDVTVAVPTSENLKYNIEADKALYDITARKWTVTAWADNPSVSWYATYLEWEEITKQEAIKDNNGKITGYKTVGTGKYHWVPYSVSGSETYGGTIARTDTYYDVNKSSIYSTQYGEDNAVNGGYTLTSNHMTLSGTAAPGPQTINVTKNGTSNSFSYSLRKFWQKWICSSCCCSSSTYSS